VPRSLPDDLVEELFGALRSNRDRALVAFWLSSGVRANELLGLRHDRVDYGRRVITVVSKGTRALDEVPASADAFVWLALYLTEGYAGSGQEPVWWTLREPRRPLTYHAARAVLLRAQRELGTRYRLHDLRHTAAARMAADPGSRSWTCKPSCGMPMFRPPSCTYNRGSTTSWRRSPKCIIGGLR
jgi:site-specific recombinase XerC